MNTFVNFANPNQAAANTAVTQAFPETGQRPDVTTLALGEEGGGQATTLAVGEEGGQPPVIPPPINNSGNGFDQATRDYLAFFRDATTQQGRVAGDGNLTRNQATNQLSTYTQQLQTLKTLQLWMQALDAGSSSRVQNLYDQLSNRYEAGTKLVSFFNQFAGKTGPTDTVQASDINSVAFRDGEKKDVSVKDLLLSYLY